MQLPKLFSPIQIGSLTLPNRVVMAPITVDFANPDETPPEQQIAYQVVDVPVIAVGLRA